MKYVISIIIVIITTSLHLAQAQDKDLSYYVDHPSEILPAARASFNAGQYKRTLDLCRFEPLLPDYQKPECSKLNEDSKKCDSILTEMSTLRESGQIKEAKAKAQELLKINPKDPASKEVLMLKEPEPEPEQESEPAPAPELVATNVPAEDESPSATNSEQPSEQENKQAEDQTQSPEAEAKQDSEPEQEIDREPDMESTESEAGLHNNDADDMQKPSAPILTQPGNKYHTRFALYAGAFVCNFYKGGEWCPEITVGLHDIGGSRFGVQLDAYYPIVTKQMIGADALLDVRIVKNLYANLGAGAFWCDSDSANGPTIGMSFAGGLSYLLFNHLSFGVGIRYLPEVKAYNTEYHYGTVYRYNNIVTVIRKGLLPSISIGWVF